MLLLGPIALSAGAVARALTAAIKGPGVRHPFVTKEELRAILKAERRAALDPDEARLINRLLGMAAARIREIMTPLPDVVSVAVTENGTAVMERIRAHGYSRLPVWQDRTDNIVGVVHAMDMIGETDGIRSIQSLMRRPFYVPEAGRLNQLLDEFRRRGHEMAIVVDEFGAASGIVTLEDVLEELVGDILDEFDRPHREILEPAGDGAWTADGTARLSDLGESLGVTFPRGGYETLAGLVAHRLQRIPKVGDRTELEGFVFRVLDATERRVRKVRIERTTARERGGSSSPGKAPS
jgi:CBS domain containing-hemolysin-like protein